VLYYKLPKDDNTPIVQYKYSTLEEFVQCCDSFNVDSTVVGVKDSHWIKPILNVLSKNPKDFIIENVDQVCLTISDLEIVQFKNTKDATHRLIIKYETLRDRISEEIKIQPSFTEKFVYFTGISFLTFCFGFTVYAAMKKYLSYEK
jgi:hypothetical protein